jgi:hypothetical protein
MISELSLSICASLINTSAPDAVLSQKMIEEGFVEN